MVNSDSWVNELSIKISSLRKKLYQCPDFEPVEGITKLSEKKTKTISSPSKEKVKIC